MAAQSTQEFSVALLIDNIAIAKEISSVLRNMGIYAHFYNELDEYWVSINSSTPDFSIIDVKKMSCGDMQFKNHPKVKNESLNFAFFYDEPNPLINSTFNLKHFGLITSKIDYRAQFETLFNILFREDHLTSINNKLNQKVHDLQQRTLRLGKNAQKGQAFEKNFYALQDLVTSFGKVPDNKSFSDHLITTFANWNACTEFGLYQLNEFGQKLISLSHTSNKYRQLPDLWLGQACHNGIEYFAQEMISEVAFDMFNCDFLKTIRVAATSYNPELVLVGTFEKDIFESFQWELLEDLLSSEYRRLMLMRVKNPPNDDRIINIWEAFNYLDDISFYQAKPKHKIIGLNFNALTQTVKEKHSNRFYWKSFYSDFISQLSQNLSGNFKITNYGVQDFFVFIDNKFLDNDFKKVKQFVKDFSYWRYFEDSSILMSNEMSPEVKVLAPSSVNAIRNIERELLTTTQSLDKKSFFREREFPVN